MNSVLDLSSGSVILKKVCTLFAPSMDAASYTSRGRFMMPAR